MYDNQELKRDAKRRHAEQKVEWETQQKEDQNQKKKERRGVQNESCSKKRNEVHEPTTMHYNAIYVRNNFQGRNFLIGSTLLMYI